MLDVIPTLKNADVSGGTVSVKACVSAPEELCDAVRTLCDFARRVHGIEIARAEGGISFCLGADMAPESYELRVDGEGARVIAADLLGAHNAAVTLVQLMERAEDGIALPEVSTVDIPDCSWRGVMIDLARNWHESDMLYDYVDMCRFYKVKYLHLHFTDDQSFTLPMRAFPKLPTEGRSYSEAEIKDFLAYAKLRGVEVIPELDVPGHTRSLSEAYGELFGEDGLVCQSAESMEGIRTIFGELCELFPDSNYIHIGGDEAQISKWTKCEKCMSAYRDMGYDVDNMEQRELEELMYGTFLKRVCEMVLSFGKTPVVWEGFAKEVNHLIPRETVVASWENLYQTTPSLLEAGFRLINCSWVPMYVLAPDKHWSPREIYQWDPYYWRPCHSKSPYFGKDIRIEPTKQIEGGELLAWGDHIIWAYANDIRKGVEEERRLVEERVGCLAENTWNVKKTCWDGFFFRAYVKARNMHEKLRENRTEGVVR